MPCNSAKRTKDKSVEDLLNGNNKARGQRGSWARECKDQYQGIETRDVTCKN